MAHPQRTLGAMPVVSDAAQVIQAGSWVVAGTDGPAGQVRSLVPDVFEDYARIFHPARRRADERDLALCEPGTGVGSCEKVDDIVLREVRWREVAQANGKVVHPAMQWPSITASEDDELAAQAGLWEQAPQSGSLPLRLTRVLCEILADFTATPERCWCAVWEGYAHMVGLRGGSSLPRLAMWNRPMIVACGPLSAVPEKSFTDGSGDPYIAGGPAENYRSPSLWWPDDRAWCVATDVDMQDTYLGASRACVDRLLTDERLEVMRVTADQDISWESDVINGPQRLGGGG